MIFVKKHLIALSLVVLTVAVSTAVLFKAHSATAALSDSLISYWKLDETSGSRADSVGSNTMAITSSGGALSSAAGKIGNATTFNGTGQYLSAPDSADLSTGDVDYTFGGWVYINSKAANFGIVGKFNSTTQREYLLSYSLSSDKLVYTISPNGTQASQVQIKASNYGSPQLNTWIYVLAWHDSVNNTINIQVNNGTVNSTSYSSGGFDTPAALQIGVVSGTSVINGAVDEVGFWKRTLTSDERTTLYNSGSGKTYPLDTTAPDAPTALDATSTIDGQADLAWTAPANDNGSAVTDYVVEYKLSADSSWTTFSDGTSTTTSATVTGLTSAASYDFRVSAVSAAGTSTPSATDTVTIAGSSSTIALTTPKQYQVFQRDGSNQASISISGTYTGTPASIEASWNGGAYSTIVASPSGGTFSGSLSNQTGGQGTLTVRFSDDVGTAASTTYVGVGDVYVIAGQSNASGRGSANQSYSHATLKAGLFGNNDTWSELTDPTDSNTGQVDSVSSDSTAHGSPWPSLATDIMANENVPVAFIPTAMGGTSILQWQKNSSSGVSSSTTTAFSSCSTTLNSTGLYGSMSRRINEVTGGVKAILWIQGEKNIGNGTSRSDYKNYLRCFADNAQADFGVKTMAAQVGPKLDEVADSINNVRLAQQDLWDENGNVLPGVALYDLPVSASDSVHYVTNTALTTIGHRFYASLKAQFYGGGDARGPRFTSATKLSDNTTIRVKFNESTLPVLPSSSINGFSVKNDGSAATISSVTRVASDTVEIILSAPSTGTTTVSYASGDTMYGLAPLTDSSTYTLPAEPFIDQSVASASLTVAQSGGTTAVTEGGSTDSYTVVLNSQPSADVVVAVSSNNTTTGATVSPSSLTFTSANWDTPQTVTVTATNDSLIESSQSAVISHTVTSADTNYDGASVGSVTPTITDNDVASITLTQSSGTTAVTEGGATDSYTLVLTSQPTADVVVTTTSQNTTTGVTISPATTTFTSANWDTPQTITVTAVNDTIAEGGATTSITHSISSADTNYDNYSIANVTANVTDNDTASITVAESSGSTAVTEGGSTDSYTLVLTSQPSADVVVAVSSDDTTTGATVSPSSLTFTSSNWSTPQTVTVTAVNDYVIEGTHQAVVSQVVSSADTNYDGATVADVTATITDNDTAGATVTQSAGSTNVTEGAATDTYTVALNAQPTANVVVSVTSQNTTTGVTVSPASLTFTSVNWQSAQTVTVTAVDDSSIEGDHTTAISFGATSSDLDYNGLSIGNLTANVADNDTPGFAVVESSGSTMVVEGGSTDSYTIVLNSQPSADVVVGVSSNNTITGATVSPASLTFTSSNWNTPQTVTVTAVDDDTVEASQVITISHPVTSVDSDYDGASVGVVEATIMDNDVVVTPVVSGDTLVAPGASVASVGTTNQPLDEVQDEAAAEQDGVSLVEAKHYDGKRPKTTKDASQSGIPTIVIIAGFIIGLLVVLRLATLGRTKDSL